MKKYVLLVNIGGMNILVSTVVYNKAAAIVRIRNLITNKYDIDWTDAMEALITEVDKELKV